MTRYIQPLGVKRCTKCDEVKSVIEFHKRKNRRKNPSGRESSCKQCRKEAAQARGTELKDYLWAYNLRTKYGLSVEDYDAMWEEQGGRCLTCLRSMTTPSRPTKNTDVNVDHCHTTGIVRGLLCVRCNRGIGYFGEDIDTLLRCVEHLRKDRG